MFTWTTGRSGVRYGFWGPTGTSPPNNIETIYNEQPRGCFGSIFILFSIKVAGGRLSGENPCPPTLNDNPGTGKELLLDTGLLLMDAFPKFWVPQLSNHSVRAIRKYYPNMTNHSKQIYDNFLLINFFILLHEKFLQFDWLRAVAFQLNLKYLHGKITNLLWVVI